MAKRRVARRVFLDVWTCCTSRSCGRLDMLLISFIRTWLTSRILVLLGYLCDGDDITALILPPLSCVWRHARLSDRNFWSRSAAWSFRRISYDRGALVYAHVGRNGVEIWCFKLTPGWNGDNCPVRHAASSSPTSNRVGKADDSICWVGIDLPAIMGIKHSIRVDHSSVPYRNFLTGRFNWHSMFFFWSHAANCSSISMRLACKQWQRWHAANYCGSDSEDNCGSNRSSNMQWEHM